MRIKDDMKKGSAEIMAGVKDLARRPGMMILIFFFALPFAVRGCAPTKKPSPHPRPVETALAAKKDVSIYLDAFGQMVSTGDVDIRPQVTGKILEVKFVQGDEVKKGDILFLIDPAPYQAEFSKAEALLKKDTALMRLKSDTLSRNRRLFEKGLISRQQMDEFQTDFEAAAAAVELDKAALESARINLEYCEIKSPVRGLAGKRMVDAGNIVSANSDPALVNIKVMDELYVDFSLPEKDLASVRSAMQGGALETKISVPGKDKEYVSGWLNFVDNAVDERTGSFGARATVDNRDGALWPGQFVTVRLILGVEQDAVVVPSSSARIGKQGYYLFILGKDNLAELRQITVGARQNGDIAVETGVDEGEVVVTSGQLGLRSGMAAVDVAERTSNTGAKSTDKK